jgi:opacity protein-like surface antigen
MKMRKLTLAVIASSTVALQASYANISTGYYVGAHAGYGATTAKNSGVLAQNTPAGPAGTSVTGSVDIGSTAPNIGIMGGYGWVYGCMYYGGELAYTYENTKINDTIGQGGVVNGAALSASAFKRSGYFHVGLRGGYLFTPNTMFYIRLGANFGKWTINDTLNYGFSTAVPGNGSKNRLTFTPGLGLETAIHQHVYLRVEYVFEWGPGVKATNANFPAGATNISNVRTQAGKVGLAYKF